MEGAIEDFVLEDEYDNVFDVLVTAFVPDKYFGGNETDYYEHLLEIGSIEIDVIKEEPNNDGAIGRISSAPVAGSSTDNATTPSSESQQENQKNSDRIPANASEIAKQYWRNVESASKMG